MLITKTVIVKWNPRNIKHLVSKGYTFTKFGDGIEIKIVELSRSSDIKVEISCDYCGTIITRRYADYTKRLYTAVTKKDCCKECSKYKSQETRDLLYDGKFPMQIPELKEKIVNKLIENAKDENKRKIKRERTRKTSMKKYGTNHPTQSEKIKKRIVETNIKKYGVDHYVQTEEFKKKFKEISLEKYGCENPSQNEGIKEKTKNTNKERYGCDYYTQTEEFKIGVSGSNSYLWKGGITPESIAIRTSTEYKEWRFNVFKRDNFHCCICGKKSSGDIQAHHLKSFSDYPDSRFDINNGITLCKAHHDNRIKNSFHYIYGNLNITEEQFIEYIIKYRNGNYNNEVIK